MLAVVKLRIPQNFKFQPIRSRVLQETRHYTLDDDFIPFDASQPTWGPFQPELTDHIKSFGGCSLLTRIACHGARNYYIEHHIDRYIEILSNAEYKKTMNFSNIDVQRELSCLLEKRCALRANGNGILSLKL